ncbi:MAG: sulfatase [Myxococcota bacterium]
MRSRLRSWWCALGGMLALGCGAGDAALPAPRATHPTAAARFDLATYLPVAMQMRTPGARGRGPLARALPDAAIVQRAGSLLTWHFPLPDEAHVRGRLTLAAEDEAFALLTVLDETGERRELRLEADGRAEQPLDWDLSELGGRMARVQLQAGARAVWHALRIEGAPAVPEPRDAGVRRGRYNVLFVLFDTLRPDRTEPYGADSPRTPHLRRLAERGVVFENAFSTAPWTSPSVASMLTGVHATVHRVRGPPWSGDPKAPILPVSLPYLPELLSREGWATAAVVNNPMIAPSYGFDRGFDRADAYFTERDTVVETLRTPQEQADAVWDRFVAPTVERSGDRPFFVYLHEIDPHNPYAPPPPFDTMYDPDYAGDVETFTIHHIARYNAGAPRSEADLRHVKALYQGEVTFMDAYLGRILERLSQSGLAEDTLLVFTSDHGEGFGEHGLFGHGVTLHEEMVRVPVLLSLPGVLPEGRRVTAPFQLLDLTPTLLDLLGIDAPPEMQGHSLLPWVGAQTPPSAPPRPLFFRAFFVGRFNADAVRYGDWKLQRHNDDLEGGTKAKRYELFNLRADALEKRDRWARRPIVGHTLRQMLEWQHLQDAKIEVVVEKEAAAPDAAMLEQLRELGYVE